MKNIKNTSLEEDLINHLKNYNKTFNDDLETHLTLLKESANELLNNQDFQIGDIVIWKPNLKNRYLPLINQPCFVIELIQNPEKFIINNILYYNDICLGFLMDDGTFEISIFDKNQLIELVFLTTLMKLGRTLLNLRCI